MPLDPAEEVFFVARVDGAPDGLALTRLADRRLEVRITGGRGVILDARAARRMAHAIAAELELPDTDE